MKLEPPPGIKASRIVSLADDIALSLAAVGVRIEAPVPGKSVVGIEVPNKERSTVYLKEVLQSPAFLDSPSKVTIRPGQGHRRQPGGNQYGEAPPPLDRRGDGVRQERMSQQHHRQPTLQGGPR